MLVAGYQMPDAGSGAKERKVQGVRCKEKDFGVRAVDFGPIPVSGGSLLQSEFRNPKSKIEGRDAGLKGIVQSAEREKADLGLNERIFTSLPNCQEACEGNYQDGNHFNRR